MQLVRSWEAGYERGLALGRLLGTRPFDGCNTSCPYSSQKYLCLSDDEGLVVEKRVRVAFANRFCQSLHLARPIFIPPQRSQSVRYGIAGDPLLSSLGFRPCTLAGILAVRGDLTLRYHSLRGRGVLRSGTGTRNAGQPGLQVVRSRGGNARARVVQHKSEFLVANSAAS